MGVIYSEIRRPVCVGAGIARREETMEVQIKQRRESLLREMLLSDPLLTAAEAESDADAFLRSGIRVPGNARQDESRAPAAGDCAQEGTIGRLDQVN